MKILVLSSVLFMLLVLTNSCGVKGSLKDRPDLTGIEQIDTLRTKHNDSLYTLGKNSLSKNQYGIWELYVEGDALERGLVTGSLTRELIAIQERAIMENIESLVPSKRYQNFLWKVVNFFNRKMHLHVPEEYKAEIYGISRFALNDFNEIADPYIRGLYLHGAHDIGHALQDFMLVGCTSFAAWDSRTEDGQLLLGRNFDFYAGDDFAKEKIAAFVNPENGHKFMMYTWGGMIGVVSGMNVKGITVTINAGKSRIPLVAKTPISLVAREILQYAETTEEAIAIARKREVFVSEAIMVGSASERKAILIEVAPNNFGVFEVINSNALICSNHFQSIEFKDDRKNLNTLEKSHSLYRFQKMDELLAQNSSLDPKKAVTILRNMEGLKGASLGMGNEKAINQLLAHHGVIFKPDEYKVWVSANPYQLGAFVAYDIKEAFNSFENGISGKSVFDSQSTIPKDDFLDSSKFIDYKEFSILSQEIRVAMDENKDPGEEKLMRMIHLNPNFWKSWAIGGEYYFKNKDFKKAVIYFKQALQREVTTFANVEWLEKMIKKSYRKLTRNARTS